MSDSSNRDVEIFEAALRLAAVERSAFLDQVCAGNDELREQVESLLGSHERVGDFLEQSPAEAERSGSRIGEKPGNMIGRYKLLEQIGEGGCGVVYMAEQREPVRRRVALKIIKPGMDTKGVIARFEAERQALALMDHPNIAKVFDAGATESGRPYFVMELVRGVKITEYCDKNSLTTEERLNLFMQVCHAIQHAHQKGIIHRDIKPSNILVTQTLEGAALPVVIDFGIAKATTNQQLTDKTVFTAFEMLIGTPAYMSPEQAALTSVDVDTRTDIYSLGVLLYELLTGSTPFDARELLKAGINEVRRVICEDEPERPSTRLSKLTPEDLTNIAESRRSEAPRLIRSVRGDLDWIVMKALEKDRTRRYASANGLALDVQRFLADEAITARPPSRVYRFEMLVLRNKLLFTAIGAMALLLVGALIVVSLALSRERESRRKAVEASVKSQRVTQFLEDMMNRAGPAAARGRDSGMMIDILNETAGHIEKELGNQPDVEADLRGIIGKLYEQLGLYAQGEKMERQALAFREQKFGPESREAAESLNDLGLELMAQHKLPEAEKAHARAYAIRRRLFGDENAETATSLNDLGAVYRDQGRLKEAEAMAREALRIRRKLFGPQHQDVADSLRNLSIILGGESRWEEAKQAAMETLIMRSNVLGPDHPFIASSLEDVAWTDSGLGQFKEAEQLDAEALALRQRVLGDAHPDIGRNLNALGQLLFNQRDVPTSEAVLKVALSIQRKLVGETNQATLETLDALARDLANEDKYAEAESVSREALAVWNTRSDNDNPQRLFLLRDLAEILEKENRWPEAEALWRESLPLWRQRRNIEDSEPMYTLRKLGLALEAEHKFPEAEAVHREAWSISRKKGDEDAEAVADLGKLGRVLLNQKKFAEAQEILDKALTPTMVRQPWSASLQAERVAVMGRQGRWPDAEKDAALAIEYQPTDHYSYHILAGLLAIQQERPAYEKLCQRMFTNFSNPENPYIAERIAQDCLLLTNSGVDLRLVDKLADTAVTRGSSEASLPYFQACKAMSSYRLGRFREAILWGERSVSKPTAEAPGKAKALAVLAMAHWQLGEKDEARTALASGDNLAPRLLPGVGPVDLADSWVAWLQARISLDEAASMIEPASALEGPPKN